MSDQPISKAMQLCRDLVHDAGKTRAWIAAEVGYGASHIRRYMLGHYEGQAEKLEVAIVKRFDRRICPHDGQEKQPIQCQRVAFRARPYGFPDAETLWLACQNCPHKPTAPEGNAK